MDRKLTFKRVTDPYLVPKKYVDRIKARTWTTEKWYKTADQSAHVKTEYGKAANLDTYLLLAVDAEQEVVGFIWMQKDDLNDCLWLNNVSIDSKYWNQGITMSDIIPEIKKIMYKESLEKVIWTTTRPRYGEKYGFKRCAHTLMEYNLMENSHGHDETATDRQHRSAEPHTA